MTLFGLADCNNFFVSCERVFRPDLTGRPVIVLSSNDGCVISRSNEAKQLGIKMGAPLFQIKNEIERHNIAIFSSNFELYGDISSRVMSLLSKHTPDFEQYSIDEAFLDFTGLGTSEQIRDKGTELVRTIQKCVHIPVSIGIAPTRTLAKVASKFAKKYPGYKGVCIIDTDEKRLKALKMFDVADVFGIGRRSAKKLNYMGIKTAYDFTMLDEKTVRQWLSVTGLRTQKELKGISCIQMEELPMKQSICTSRSFAEQGISEQNALEEAIATFASDCSRKLRKQKSCCSGINVFARTSLFRENAPQDYINVNATFPVATDSVIEIVDKAIQMIRSRFRNGFQYKKAGVILYGISMKNAVQYNLFDTIDRSRQNKLTTALDSINSQYGKGTIKLAVEGDFANSNAVKSEHRSPRYSTKWDEIPQINCKK